MKPLYLDRSNTQNESFSVAHRKYPNFLKVWHYHSELELVVLVKSTGTQFIGDHIGAFAEGEIILIGKNLPHMMLNDPDYFEEDSKLRAEAIVVHFKEDFVGESFLEIPEMKGLSKLLNNSKRGIRFKGHQKHKILKKVKRLMQLSGFEKVIGFLQVLQDLSSITDYELLTSLSYIEGFDNSDKRRLEPVYNYIFNNFKNEFSLKDVAELAHMNPSAFSRYFKRVHHKTFTKYVNELRVGYACKLLLEEKYSKTDICFECGFNNLSNFNRQFKTVTSYSPSEYLTKQLDIV